MMSRFASSQNHTLRRSAVALSVLLYLLVGLHWISSDNIPRDGDEEGHVGAAELVMHTALANPLEGVGMAVAGELGHYPPLYPGLIGFHWALMGGGDPGRLIVRSINLLWPLLAACFIWFTLRRSSPTGAAIGTALFLWSPGVVGMSRHFMPEGLLLASVAGVLWGLTWLRRTDRAWAPSLLGALVAVALLIKQTSVLYLLGPLVFGLPRDRRAAVVLVTAAILIAPWYFPHLGDQAAYGAASVSGDPGVPLWRHVGFYPASLVLGVLGPGFAFMLLPDRKSDPVSPSFERTLAWVAFASGLLLLCFVPKKYPRLLLPLLPAVFLLIGLHFQSVKQKGVWVCLAAIGVGWTGGLSAGAFTLPRAVEVIDGRCPQRWIRAPIADDWGFERVVEASRQAPPGGVFVEGAPEIPCTLQTTFPWDYHLGPALRRAGQDRTVAASSDSAAISIVWGAPSASPSEHSVFVPTLGRWFEIHLRAQ